MGSRLQTGEGRLCLVEANEVEVEPGTEEDLLAEGDLVRKKDKKEGVEEDRFFKIGLGAGGGL